MVDENYPIVPKALLDKLSEVYKDSIRNIETLDQLMVHKGRQEVIDYLYSIYFKQNNKD